MTSEERVSPFSIDRYKPSDVPQVAGIDVKY